MNRQRFDELTRSLITRSSRRMLVAGLAGSVIAPRTIHHPQVASAKRKRKHKHKKKTKLNAFGCVNVGGFCQNSGQCCSGICEGKKGKKTCQAHNVSTCEGTNGCSGEFVPCTTDTGADGTCNVTTGNANYCVTIAVCFECTKDTDCEPVCGAGAACIVCAECGALTPPTACASTNANGCFYT